jgi:hypothetical protein
MVSDKTQPLDELDFKHVKFTQDRVPVKMRVSRYLKKYLKPIQQLMLHLHFSTDKFRAAEIGTGEVNFPVGPKLY